MNRWSPLLPLGLAPAGGLLIVLAERIWPGTAATPYLAALGAAAVLAALALHLPPFRVADTAEGGAQAAGWRRVLDWPAVPHALFVLAVALYFGAGALPPDAADGALDWAALATAGWMLCATAGAVLYGFTALAQSAQHSAPGRDPRRMAAAGAAGLSMALLVVLLVLVNFIGNRVPVQWNVAYFNITQPSEATLEVARGLSEPVDVAVFFAAGSEVGPLAQAYFDSLRASLADDARLRIHLLDADLRPDEAEAYKARGNGWVVLRKGDLTRPINIGETLERARGPLRRFDRNFFSKLIELAQPRGIAYLTVGHGERNERGQRRSEAESFNRMRTLLRDRNYTVKELGLSEGSAERIPADADLVVAVAPRQPFLAAEVEALRAYLSGGGKMLAFLEPARGRAPTGSALPGTPLEAVLAGYGVEFEPVLQANDRIYGRRTYTRADHALLVTVAYENHPSVRSLRRVPGQFPLLLLGAGSLRAGTVPEGLEVKETVKGMPGTWGDVDGDYAFSAARETRGQPVLGMAVAPKAKRPQRRRGQEGGQDADPPSGQPPKGPTLLVLADADLAGDLLLQNRANQQFIEDALQWLVRQEAPTGLPESEEDVRIQHAKGDDWLWFYLPVLGVPALALGFGAVRVRRQRRRSGGVHD